MDVVIVDLVIVVSVIVYVVDGNLLLLVLVIVDGVDDNSHNQLQLWVCQR